MLTNVIFEFSTQTSVILKNKLQLKNLLTAPSFSISSLNYDITSLHNTSLYKVMKSSALEDYYEQTQNPPLGGGRSTAGLGSVSQMFSGEAQESQKGWTNQQNQPSGAHRILKCFICEDSLLLACCFLY